MVFEDDPARGELELSTQLILAELGVHEIIVAFLEREIDGVSQTDLETTGERTSFYTDKLGEEHLDVFRVCFRFLYYFVCSVRENKQALSKPRTIATLLRYLNWWPENGVIVLLTEILANNDQANDYLRPHDLVRGLWCKGRHIIFHY